MDASSTFGHEFIRYAGLAGFGGAMLFTTLWSLHYGATENVALNTGHFGKLHSSLSISVLDNTRPLPAANSVILQYTLAGPAEVITQ